MNQMYILMRCSFWFDFWIFKFGKKLLLVYKCLNLVFGNIDRKVFMQAVVFEKGFGVICFKGDIFIGKDEILIVYVVFYVLGILYYLVR